MAKYKVMVEKLELTGRKGTFTWDKNAEVTEVQVNDKDAEKLVKAGKLKVLK